MGKSKLNNTKVIIDNINFASKMEADFYLYLCDLHKKVDIIIQPKFLLQDKFIKYDKTFRKINYIADFEVNGIVYDVKGFTTTDFAIKRKLFDYKYPCMQLCVITKCPIKLQNTYGEWIEIDALVKERTKSKKLKAKLKA